MNYGIKIEKEVRYDTENRQWMATVDVYLRADDEHYLHRLFRNKEKVLLNEKLTKTWGDFNTDGVRYWRRKEDFNVFDSYSKAKEFTEKVEIDTVRFIENIVRENLAAMRLESDELIYFDIDEENAKIKVHEERGGK